MELTPETSAYYNGMFANGRCYRYYEDDKLIGLVTFFVGDDDKKYLYDKTPWSIVDDDPLGKTVYVDQLITLGGTRNLWREFNKIILKWKGLYPNITSVMWIRMSSDFRKHKKEGVPHGFRKLVK